jgi:type I restriction enzyme, R subunit
MANKYHSQPEYIHVERPILKQLAEQGGKDDQKWTVLELDMWGQTPQDSFRESFDDFFMQSKLLKALDRINKDKNGDSFLTEDHKDDLIRRITSYESRDLLQINETFTTQFLFDNHKVDNEKTGEKGLPVKLIDFENPENNEYLAVSQFRLNIITGEPIFPDITLFINGLPVGVIECKYARDVISDPVLTGIQDLRNYQELNDVTNDSIKKGNSKLFWFNQILISCDQNRAQYGTIKAAEEHFIEWKTIHPVDTSISYKTGEKQNLRETLTQGMLTPENLLDIILHFNIFMDVETASGGTIRVKVLCRYQQFRSVQKAITRLETEKTPEKRSGVIWHTQGSGKSLTMVFLVRKLRTVEELKSYKVVFVTDRVDLDDQLGKTAGLSGETVRTVSKVNELEKELGNDTNDIVMCMIQKFQTADDEDELEGEVTAQNNVFPELNKSPKVLVLVDEAHRTHNSSLGVRLNCALPNATKIAFTGTPLITNRHKKKTHETFGTYIDEYKFNEAIDDGATLKILYEGKTGTQDIDGESFDSEFEDMFSDKTPEEIEAIKQKYGTRGDILEAPKRINHIAKDLVKHYVDNILPNGFKAQVVASSRVAAHRYVESINTELKRMFEEIETSEDFSESTKNRLKIAKAQLVISAKHLDKKKKQKLSKEELEKHTKDEKIIEDARKESEKTDAIKNFKKAFDPTDPDTGICFLVVKDMLLTGFDAPIEQVMYVDKKMIEHNLLQAIARVNRKSKGKSRGYVVDYYGIVNHLNAALAIYTREDTGELDDYMEGALERINEEIPELERRYNAQIQLFEGQGIDKIASYVNGKMSNPDEINQVHLDCIDALITPDVRGRFEAQYRAFLESMDIIMPDRRCAKYLLPMKMFGRILVEAKRTYERTATTVINGAGEKVRHLINKYFEVENINTRVIGEVGSDSFNEELENIQRPRTQAALMQHSLANHILRNMNSNPAHYENLSEKLRRILEEFAGNWEEQIIRFREMMDEAEHGPRETIVDKETDPFIHLFIKRVKEQTDNYDESKYDEYVSLVTQIVKLLSEKIKQIGPVIWAPPHVSTRSELEGEVQDLLIRCEEIYDAKEQIASEFLQLAKEILS